MPSPTRRPPPQPLRRYGYKFDLAPYSQCSPEQLQLLHDQLAFRQRWPIEAGGLPRHEHFRNMTKVMWPWLDWHPWLEWSIETMCNHQFLGMTGCASSSKTTAAVIYAVGSWVSAMDCTSVILTSTTKNMIRKRAWPWVQRLYTGMNSGNRIGNLVDSKSIWQFKKGDDLNAIFGIAVKEGSSAKAVAHIQGIHNKRIIVIVDEATDTPEAILEACTNLMTGCDDFQLIVIGNAASRLDPHGKFCEPKEGWNSITVDDEEWETVTQLNNKPGICIHFDAEKSPNIISGETRWRYLPNRNGVTAKREKLGENSPLYWKFERGFWAPEGIIQTVLTESLLIRHEMSRKHTWVGGAKLKMAFLDPAFGGADRPILRFGEMGDIATGGVGLELTERIQLTIDIRPATLALTPVHYQLANQVKSHCVQRGVAPNCFGLDSTGEGGGLADIISREWSPDIQRVEFGGKPSDRPVSNEDRRPCHEVYDRKVTELWFTVKELGCSGQLKGIDSTSGVEFCNRLWRLKGKKIEIEPKTKRKGTGDAEETGTFGMKERFGRSPDNADADAGLCEVARRHGLIAKLTGQTVRREDSWLKMARQYDEIYQQPENDDALGGLQVVYGENE